MKTLKPASLYMHYSGVASIPLNISGLPVQITVGGKIWYRKPEFHVSAIYVKLIAPQLAATQGIAEEAARDILWKAAERVAHTEDIGAVSVTGELRHAKDAKQETIVVMCDVEGIVPLYKKLNAHPPAHITPPPTHITLYTDPEGAIGVPLPSSDDLKKRTRLLEGSELAEVKRAMNFGEVFGSS